MPVDLEYLRRHYASLSDEALLELDRSELVETAKKCYDEELARRKPLGGTKALDQTADLESQVLDGDNKLEWLGDASEVFSQVDRAGAAPAPDIANARDALEAAGIPCHLELSAPPEEEEPPPQKPIRLWRLMVPGNLNQRATSILERDIFNAEFEAEWKTHLEMLSDEELRSMDPKVAFCGLFDRVERVTRAFDEEIARRQSKSRSPWFR
jgi:hypothetical protein